MTRHMRKDWRTRTMAKATARRQAVATANDRVPNSTPQRRTTENDIARRAYDLYLARGREDGHDVEDWLRAERELNGTVSTIAV